MKKRLTAIVIIGLIAIAVAYTLSSQQSSDDPLLNAINQARQIKKPAGKRATLETTTKSAAADSTSIETTFGLDTPTSRSMARIACRANAGRDDPFASLTPARSKDSLDSGGDNQAIPPPPDSESLLPPEPSDSPPDMALPPEPTAALPVNQLPDPPPDQGLLGKLRLNAILGDRVILVCTDRDYRRRHGYRKYITLARGEKFDTVRLESIGKDKALLEEYGETKAFSLPEIR